jgi:hypothetical protein
VRPLDNEEQISCDEVPRHRILLGEITRGLAPALKAWGAQQLDRSGQPIPPILVRIVVFANNCSDKSASIARSLGEGWSLHIRVIEARLPPGSAYAGNARRAAMDIAEAWLWKEAREAA